MAGQTHLNLQDMGLSRRVSRHVFLPLPLWASWQSAIHTVTQIVCSPDKTQDHKRTWAPSKSTSTFYINLNSWILWVLSTLLESFSSLFFSGQIWIWEIVCFFSVSTLFSVQWKVALEILPCGLTLTKTSITHHQVTPIPDLGSEHIRGVSQVIPRRVLQTLSAMPETQEMRVQSLGREDPWKKEMATHSSILAWRISWTEEPGGLQFMGSQSQEQLKQLSMHAYMHTWWNYRKQSRSERTQISTLAPEELAVRLWASPGTSLRLSFLFYKRKYYTKLYVWWW